MIRYRSVDPRELSSSLVRRSVNEDRMLRFFSFGSGLSGSCFSLLWGRCFTSAFITEDFLLEVLKKFSLILTVTSGPSSPFLSPKLNQKLIPELIQIVSSRCYNRRHHCDTDVVGSEGVKALWWSVKTHMHSNSLCCDSPRGQCIPLSNANRPSWTPDPDPDPKHFHYLILALVINLSLTPLKNHFKHMEYTI